MKNSKPCYRTTRRFESSPLSLPFLLDQNVVHMVEPGTLVIDTVRGSNGKPVEWHEVEPGVWQNAANPLRRRYFLKNAQGDWEMSRNGDPMQIMQKVSWYQHKLVMLPVLVLSIATVLLSVLMWPLSVIWRIRSGPQAALSPVLRTARNHMRLAGLLSLLPWALYGGILLAYLNNSLFIALPTCAILLRVVQILAWLAVGGTTVALRAVWLTWPNREASLVSRVHSMALALACLGATAVAWQGSFLIWNWRY
ncbi:hypothetical protein [Duganella sp. BJB488]|uniref:hypothetical protein n=1 Tax=Duganella sp. BJB488 TaxID=1871350 RepID=UPI001E4A81B8|nr:hypothetical protein [Duganella sp. BJB488]